MKVEKAELIDKIPSIIQSLEADIEDATGLINVIDSFIREIESGKNLSGKSYNKVKEKLSKYKEVLEKRKTTANSLKTAIKSAVNQMIAYIGDDDCIDQSLEAEINSYRSQALGYIEQIRIDLETVASKDDELKLRGQMAKQKNRVDECNYLLKKIEGLTDKDNYAYSILDSAIADISNYNSRVNDLQESQIINL